MNVRILLFFAFFAFLQQAKAQCPTSTPGALSGTMSNVLVSDTLNTPVYTVTPSGLPNTEFILIQNDTMADDMLGPPVLSSSLTGQVVASDFGLGTCNEICVVPFSYNLSQLQTVVDSLFAAYYVPGTTCCDAAGQFFIGICDSLVAHGISSGADVANLNNVITLMNIFAGTGGGTISLTNLISTIDQLNAFISLFGPCAGGVSQLCYAVSNTTTAMDCYTIVEPNAATSVDIVQDTVWLAPSATTTLSGSFLPGTANDSLTWYVSNSGSSINVDPATGMVTAGSTLDTAWIIAQAVRGCATDVTVVIVDPALALTRFDMTQTALQVFPNPFEKNLQVRFHVEAGDYNLELVSVMGQVVYRQNHSLSQGNQAIDINTEEIPNGYYYLRVLGQNTQGVQAVVKQ